MKTKIVHCMIEPYEIYIGRGRGSKWGNPFTHKDGIQAIKVATVEEAVAKYEEYILGRPDLLAALPELDGKVLGCWCKTKRNPDALCHGDILVKLIEKL